MNGKKVQRGEWRVESEWRWERIENRAQAAPRSICNLQFAIPNLQSPRSRRAFTLVELLVTITIIGIVAGMSLGALSWARKFAAEEKTKATIAKLDAIIMKRYESYRTRRVPINTTLIYNNALTYYISNPPPAPLTPQKAALQYSQWAKLDALRDLMRMEMPDCSWDVWDAANNIPRGPQALGIVPIQYGISARPAKLQYYASKNPWIDPGGLESYDSAQCLYLIVSANADDLAQFSQNEIGTVGPNGNRVFIDGWGKPIMFIRWAPGYPMRWDNTALAYVPTGVESIQDRNASSNHDPYDTRKLDGDAFNLIPLIYSAGPDGKYGLWLGDVKNGSPAPVPYTDGHIHPHHSHTPSKQDLPHLLGEASPDNPDDMLDNITNHQIEMN